MKRIIKRLFDLTIAVLSLLLLFAPMILVMIILKFTGEGEIFYLQKRLGYLNNEFKIIKFATMVKNSPNIGTGSLTLRGDPRVLPFGNFLRKSKINELPQIFNVIIGNMSIVGPRPQMKVDFDKFPPKKRNEIYKSKPGITGIGSIIFRDEEKWISNFNGDKHEFYKNKIAPYKTDVELWYYKNQSMFVDVKLVILTAWVIIFPNSDFVERVFKSLPKKPSYLQIYK
jgi:lipopolysaccharide/colanic/teichoic acid biosynthesis glycosyltransferase|tara:strand:+ start:1248 stop:1928 length:681 start_codon:yes stop_codon:yes gene_type:complete